MTTSRIEERRHSETTVFKFDDEQNRGEETQLLYLRQSSK
jgi:hypothetical protein